MSPIVDWLMILFTTILTYKSYKKLVFYRYCSVSFYVILIVYILLCPNYIELSNWNAPIQRCILV